MESKTNTPKSIESSSESRKWEYQCIYCSETIYSGRALGGHQNAHRFEIREKKRTHHLRLPRRNRQVVQSSSQPNVQLQPPTNVQPLIPVTGHSSSSIQSRPPTGTTGFAPGRPLVVLPPSGRHGLVSTSVLGRGPLPPVAARGDNHYQLYPMPIIPQDPSPQPETKNLFQDWNGRVDIAGKGSLLEGSPEWTKFDPGNKSAGTSGTSVVEDGVEVASEKVVDEESISFCLCFSS
ncbi:hypothetical protein F0562_017217 [Nyssa sinensis]|uniref:C2H2-type domain-containing protein n=1 Tax=Nyssa sinensis TaxID=561372 RepID=A0A5J4ZEL8_9ASTE|nr:hypothetical protein F0562_017217 [Nyssa sinensis]